MAVAVVVFVAAAAIGRWNLVAQPVAGHTDTALAVSVLLHVILACVLTLVQWTIGAGIARALLSKETAQFSEIMLAGFPLSLVAAALLCAVALAVPYGGTLAVLLALLCVLPLARWPLEPEALRAMLACLPALLAVSVAFGTWMTLMWHGPTATLSGFPLGDHIFYASTMWALEAYPIGLPNLGNEGEAGAYLNMLWPAVGAALIRVLPLDGLLFVASASAVAVLGTGLALRAYLSDHGRAPPGPLETFVLFLAIAGASWFPSWLVSSPPVAFVAPLTISVWFWSRRGQRSESVAVATAALALVGSALTKVVAAGTLLPFALASLADKLRLLPRAMRAALLVIVLAAGIFAAWLAGRYGAIYWYTAPWGPDTRLLVSWNLSGLQSGWPYLARDFGAVLLAVAAFRLMPWPAALAMTLGILLFLIHVFLLRANFLCVAIAVGLAAIDAPQRLARNRWLVVAACALILPAAALRDLAGTASGLLWTAAIAATVYVVATAAAKNNGNQLTHAPWRFAAMATSSAATLVMILCAARGAMVTQGITRSGYGELTPAFQDVWNAVRSYVPREALVFTDQTSPDVAFKGGWNTYALHGQRQVFVANWVQSPQLRTDPALRTRKLAINDDVLAGRREPSNAPTSRPYQQFAAVVSADHRMPPAWHCVYSNGTYVILLWEPVGSASQPGCPATTGEPHKIAR